MEAPARQLLHATANWKPDSGPSSWATVWASTSTTKTTVKGSVQRQPSQLTARRRTPLGAATPELTACGSWFPCSALRVGTLSIRLYRWRLWGLVSASRARPPAHSSVCVCARLHNLSLYTRLHHSVVSNNCMHYCYVTHYTCTVCELQY